MREKKRAYTIKKTKLMNTTTLLTTLLVAATFVFSSIGAAINVSSETDELNIENDVITPIYAVDGLAPQTLSTMAAGVTSGGASPQMADIEMFGYCAALCPHGEGPCWWMDDTPDEIEQISNNVLPNFAAGGTWTCDEKWLVVEYSNGALYEIIPDDGEIIEIGGGGNGLNGLALDRTTNTLYGAGSYDLFKINPEDGSQEVVGAFGTGQTHIGLAFDDGGVCYTWDVKFSGDSYIYTVDLETGEATQLFNLEKTLLYAQDGFWCKELGLLVLTAYIRSPESGGYLALVDIDAETIELVGQFENSAEITGSMCKNVCVPPEHDVGVKKILKPEDGYAIPEIPVKVLVKNYGNHSEVTDVQFEIIKCEEGPALDAENFTGGWPSDWTTDNWGLSYSNNAGGESPEAHLNRYDQYPSRESYIRPPPVNATGFEKINVYFRLYADFYYAQYSYFYLRYRKNDTSSWRDASPWDNPPGKDLGPEWYQIGCYGWGEDLGSEFTVSWDLNAYYYYFYDIYLDDYEIYGCAGCAEYAELQEDEEIPWDTEVEIDFPPWEASEWQNPEYEDTWEGYPLTAYTVLEDDNSRNDKKQKLLMLYFPFLHDVGAFELIGPETGPGQHFPVSGEIRNVGQYEECCFKTYVEIAEINWGDTTQLYSYDFPYPCYPWPKDGWTRTHGNWRCSYSSYAGGSYPEARYYYYPISYPDELRFASPGIDTTGYGAVEIEFKHRNTYSYGNYQMAVQTSTDGVTWDVVWSTQGQVGPETVTIQTGENVGGSDFHIAFTVITQSYSILYWSVDDIVVRGFPMFAAEYEDQYCIDKMPAGESFEIEFDDWTPEFLQYETTGTKTYKARIWTDLFDPEDSNHANDELAQFLELDYYHDPAVDEMDSPIDAPSDRIHYAVDCSGYPSNSRFIWFDPDEDGLPFNDIGKWPNSVFPQSATFIGDVMWVCDTTGNIWTKDPDSPDVESVGSAGTGELLGLAYHESTKVLYGMSSKNLYTIDQGTGKASMVGSMGNPGLMISLDCDRDGVMYSYELGFGTSYTYTINLDTGKATQLGVTGLSLNFGQDMAYDWGFETMYACVFNYGTFRGELHSIDLDTGKFTFIGVLDGSGPQTTTYAIPGGGLTLDVYVPLGNQDIVAIAKNYGTFPERDMSCTAEINEYINDCENGTLLYEDLIENIDILTPLVGTETLDFGTFNFATEGFYGIFVNLTDDDDDDINNNFMTWGVGADGTHPDSVHHLDPESPDGLNDYYISDLEVTLNAIDPPIGCGNDGSGVQYIKYEIDGGATQTINGPSGTFVITEDSNLHTVVYWAEDFVGNKEPENSFSFKMDQTPPVITLVYEVFSGNPLQGWEMLFQATSEDETSGMERVEFDLNDVLQDTVTGPGPLYEWSFIYHGGLKITIKAEGFDFAGLSAYAEVEPITKSLIRNSKESSQTQSNGINIRLPLSK
jgi:hypothetical protein